MDAVLVAAAVVYALEALKRARWMPYLTRLTSGRSVGGALVGAVLGAWAIAGGPSDPWVFGAAVVTQGLLQQLLYDGVVRRSRGPLR